MFALGQLVTHDTYGPVTVTRVLGNALEVTAASGVRVTVLPCEIVSGDTVTSPVFSAPITIVRITGGKARVTQLDVAPSIVPDMFNPNRGRGGPGRGRQKPMYNEDEDQ